MTDNINIHEDNRTASHNLFLFSLRIDRIAFEKIPPDTIDHILALLKQRGAKIINVENTEVNATFQTLNSCTETATGIIQNIIQASKEFNRTTHYVKIGLHVIEEAQFEGEQILKHFDAPIAACTSADPNEIIITTELHAHLPPEIGKTCKRRDNGPDQNNPFYSLSQKQPEGENTKTAFIIPSGSTSKDSLPCFYCGTTVHPAAQCPSKPIQKSTDYLNKLGYVPLARIAGMFQENFSEITRPLKKGADEGRFETLYNETDVTPFSLAFFSFYEMSEMFQIRSLQRLYVDISSGTKPQKTGSLRMGQDCLKVSRFSEAEDWFHKALVENPNDYRSVVGQGLLQMEKEDPKEALARFRMALSFPITEDQKAPIYLLCARAYETSDALELAKEETLKAMRAARGWKEAEYYYAVILAKLKETGEATDRLRKLSYSNPRYLLMAYIDPSLNRIRETLKEFLKEEMSHLRSRALESYANIKKTIEKYEKWLGPENRDHKRAYALYQKASSSLQNESVSGLADIPDFEREITALIRRFVLGRKQDLHKKIYRFNKRPFEFLKYLDHYPYKFAVSTKDLEISRKFQSLYNNATGEVQNTHPQNLENAKNLLEELVKTAKTAESARSRLETTKSLLFTGEYTFKMMRCFLIAAVISSLFFTITLLILQGILSQSVLKSLDYISFFRYGVFAGIFTGIISTGIWVKKSFAGMLAKITKT